MHNIWKLGLGGVLAFLAWACYSLAAGMNPAGRFLTCAIFSALALVFYLYYRSNRPWTPDMAWYQKNKNEITADDIPDRNLTLDLYMVRGTIFELRKYVSNHVSWQELWFKNAEGSDQSVTLGNPPFLKGHLFGVIYDRVNGACCGAINFSTGDSTNYVPGIESNRFRASFLKKRKFFKTDESSISAWGDQNVHVLPKVDAYIAKVMKQLA